MRRMVVTCCLAAMIALPRGASGATRSAADCSRTAVAAAIALAADGDTVLLPAGDCEWTKNLTIDKGITLQGAGIGRTIIRDGIPAGSIPLELMTWYLVPNQLSRMTGIDFRPGSRTTSTGSGMIRVLGSNMDSRRIRIDHCNFQELWSWAFLIDTALGVIDHNTIRIRSGLPAGVGYVKHSGWNGYAYGDGAWAAPDQFGTDQFIFFEDNTIDYLGPSHTDVLDAQAGGRYVFRYNTVSRAGIEGHGTESGGRERSTRAVEVYNNTFTGIDTQSTVTYFRGGTGVIHHNTITGFTTFANFALIHFRSGTSFSPWGAADGTNPLDANAAGGPFATGTVERAGPLTMTVAGTPWRTNQWAGYAVRRTTNLGGLAGQSFSQIQSNTANTITYKASIYQDSLQFSIGDRFEFQLVLHAMDQPGRSGGSLVSGEIPAAPRGWNDQVTSPWYEWENYREGGADVSFESAYAGIRQNEHYLNNTEKPGYTPYAYPHPLILGQLPPRAPANLRVIR